MRHYGCGVGREVEELIIERGLPPYGGVTRWLRSNASNYLAHHLGTAEARELIEQLPHLVDYLSTITSTTANLPRSIKHISERRLFRLSVADAVTGSKRWTRAINRGSLENVDAEGERHVMDLNGKYSLVRLVSPKAMAREGKLMEHCLGGGSYQGEEIYSLRDFHNLPHATIHIRDNEVVQCKGKDNKAVMPDCVPSIQVAVRTMGWDIRNDLNSIWLLKRGCTYFDIRDLPGNFVWSGNLNLSGCTRLGQLPENLEVRGNLSLSYCTGLMSLPENLRVDGSLDLSYCTGLRSLPKKLSVAGYYLALIGCTGLRSLPEDLEVRGFLCLLHCAGMSSLPPMRGVSGGIEGFSDEWVAKLRAEWNRNHAAEVSASSSLPVNLST